MRSRISSGTFTDAILSRGLKCEVASLKKRVVKLSAVLARDLEKIREAQIEIFREKFGREPGLNYPVFFDPDADHKPTPVPFDKMRESLEAAMCRAGYSDEMRPRLLKRLGFI